MSTRDTNLDSKIIESAKREFLAKGFACSSLRTICKNAGVTTGAVYKRYKGKEELFTHVVTPALNLFDHILNGTIELNKERGETKDLQKNWIDSLEMSKNWLEKVYKEHEAVKILFTKAEGTIYSNFIHDFIEQSMESLYPLMTNLEERGLCQLKLSEKEFHVFLITHWTPFFEMFINDFAFDEAISFLPKISEFLAWEKFIEYQL